MCSCRHRGDDIGLDLEVVHERGLIECHGMHKTPAMASCTTKHLPRPVPPHIIHSFQVSLSPTLTLMIDHAIQTINIYLPVLSLSLSLNNPGFEVHNSVIPPILVKHESFALRMHGVMIIPSFLLSSLLECR